MYETTHALVGELVDVPVVCTADLRRKMFLWHTQPGLLPENPGGEVCGCRHTVPERPLYPIP